MATINTNSEQFTLINVFEVDPENQQKLVNVLINATEKTMKQIPGFISATIHKSLDGKRVVNYAQWESKKHFENMLTNSEAISHMKEAESLINSFNPIQTEVIDSISL